MELDLLQKKTHLYDQVQDSKKAQQRSQMIGRAFRNDKDNHMKLEQVINATQRAEKTLKGFEPDKAKFTTKGAGEAAYKSCEKLSYNSKSRSPERKSNQSSQSPATKRKMTNLSVVSHNSKKPGEYVSMFDKVMSQSPDSRRSNTTAKETVVLSVEKVHEGIKTKTEPHSKEGTLNPKPIIAKLQQTSDKSAIQVKDSKNNGDQSDNEKVDLKSSFVMEDDNEDGYSDEFAEDTIQTPEPKQEAKPVTTLQPSSSLPKTIAAEQKETTNSAINKPNQISAGALGNKPGFMVKKKKW